MQPSTQSQRTAYRCVAGRTAAHAVASHGEETCHRTCSQRQFPVRAGAYAVSPHDAETRPRAYSRTRGAQHGATERPSACRRARSRVARRGYGEETRRKSCRRAHGCTARRADTPKRVQPSTQSRGTAKGHAASRAAEHAIAPYGAKTRPRTCNRAHRTPHGAAARPSACRSTLGRVARREDTPRVMQASNTVTPYGAETRPRAC